MGDNKSFYSPFYSKYNQVGFVPELFFNALTTTLFELFIIMPNFSLCYIFVKYRARAVFDPATSWQLLLGAFAHHVQYTTLRSNTSTLLFVYASIEILSQIMHLIYFVRISIGLNSLPIWFAKFYVVYVVISYVSTYFMYLLMSFDRLFAVSFPIFYNNLNKKLYIMGHLTTLIIFDITIFLIFIMPIFEYKNVLVTGKPIDNFLFISSINPIFPFIPLIIFIITTLIYLIIAILTKYKTGYF
uniref:Uncharacterized protein n=1 Tax=Meloidogyne enterolobii TaxID=390850 RepID=A0A6V7VLQ5_MELEN|nr:unnamed protein product [Meloidogyne enterolobii]